MEELKENDEREIQAGIREYARGEGEIKEQAETDVVPVSGKAETMLSYLSSCIHTDPILKATASAGSKKENCRVTRLSRNQQLARHAVLQPGPPSNINLVQAPLNGLVTAQLPPNIPYAPSAAPIAFLQHTMWNLPKQQEFAEDLCKLFVACNVAWNSANNPELLLFFSKYVPEAKIPDRCVLSGRVLDTLILQIEEEMKSQVAGKLGMGQCDGWKSGAKASIISTSITVESTVTHLVAAHDVSPEKKTANNLLEIVLGDIQYCETEFGIIHVGYCTDDGGDAKAMRKRLQIKLPRLVVPPCWGHQINLVVVEVLRLKIPCMESIDMAIDIAKWFTNHSRALGMLKDQQKLTERFKATHRLLTLIFPVISRWIYHFLATWRMLTLSGPIRTLYMESETLIECAGSKREAKERAEAVLAPIDDPQFWKNLTEDKIILEPLAIAAKCMQIADAGLDQVLLMLGNLYRIYSAASIPPREPRKALARHGAPGVHLDSIPQPGVYLTFVTSLLRVRWTLNPYIRASAFSQTNPAVKPIALENIAKQLFVRFFDTEPNLDFHTVFLDYSRGRKEFSADYMGLATMKQMYEQENQRLNVARVWERLDTGEPNGRNGFTRLALWLFAIIPNSAGSECGFSKFGMILNKLCTQLSIQKVRKMSTVDHDLKRKHEELGMKTDRMKRKFVRFAEQLTQSQGANMDYEMTDSFVGLSTQLVRDAEASGLGNEDEEDEEDEPGAFTILFQYPSDESDTLANGLGFYWQGGLKDLQEELELYDLLMEADDA
ncbi:ribonuclease H-like domain-containing protein [Mycena metata]|uniref:Ribonuclease H-like domain-containing protein n=1 Tax=Mycena metata TaxID=1033252 RepID=A0AAD7JFK6_9AGAR|nr:ribonuclease H-like domain-containing protein [Mycena metata]